MSDPSDFAHRVEELEVRLIALERATGVAAGQSSGDKASSNSDEDRDTALPTGPHPGTPDHSEIFWVLEGIKQRVPAPGGVFYAGAVDTQAGPVEWQIGYPTERLLGEDWATFATPLAALGHPVRLSILQAVLSGVNSAAQLSAGEGMGTTGQLYHHLHQLTAQGWLTAEGRGRYAVPPERVVPLLAILAAAHR